MITGVVHKFSIIYYRLWSQLFILWKYICFSNGRAYIFQSQAGRICAKTISFTDRRGNFSQTRVADSSVGYNGGNTFLMYTMNYQRNHTLCPGISQSDSHFSRCVTLRIMQPAVKLFYTTARPKLFQPYTILSIVDKMFYGGGFVYHSCHNLFHILHIVHKQLCSHCSHLSSGLNSPSVKHKWCQNIIWDL